MHHNHHEMPRHKGGKADERQDFSQTRSTEIADDIPAFHTHMPGVLLMLWEPLKIG